MDEGTSVQRPRAALLLGVVGLIVVTSFVIAVFVDDEPPETVWVWSSDHEYVTDRPGGRRLSLSDSVLPGGNPIDLPRSMTLYLEDPLPARIGARLGVWDLNPPEIVEYERVGVTDDLEWVEMRRVRGTE